MNKQACITPLAYMLAVDSPVSLGVVLLPGDTLVTKKVSSLTLAGSISKDFVVGFILLRDKKLVVVDVRLPGELSVQRNGALEVGVAIQLLELP